MTQRVTHDFVWTADIMETWRAMGKAKYQVTIGNVTIMCDVTMSEFTVQMTGEVIADTTCNTMSKTMQRPI